MNPSALTWLRRRCGQWRSERRYLFGPKAQPVNYTTMMSIREGDHYNQFVIEWTGKTEGEMHVALEGNVLTRNRDYFGDGAHSSQVEMIDDDTIVFTTIYGGVQYREEIRFLSHDQYCLRQTFGTDETGVMKLAGQYVEFRL